jgi:hypothetical protein
MKKKRLLWLSVLLLMLAGCSNDDEGSGYVTPTSLLGRWEAAHRSNNPNYLDTGDMWEFIFFADGTGHANISTGDFRYELKGNHIFLHFLGSETYYGQIEYEFEIESYSYDIMEWNEINRGYSGNNTIHLKFYRSDYNKNLIEPHI